MPSYLTQGITAERDASKAISTHVGLTTDTTAHNAGQTVVDPGGGTTVIKSATITDVDGTTSRHTIALDGDTDPNGNYATVAICGGALTSDAQARIVRTYTIGLGPGDTVTVAVDKVQSDVG